jgi:elongation factor P--(R)-beta-lysine ligase
MRSILTQSDSAGIDLSMHKRKAPFWEKSFFSGKRKYLEQRASIVRAIRFHFDSREFFEVQTPALQISPGMEPHLHAFSTDLRDPTGNRVERRFLHTSPEFAMKKLLAAGMDRIYQIALVYRNRERSSTHHPEFSMLEWYRSGVPYTVLMEDCETLLRACANAVGEKNGLTWQGLKSDPSKPFERLTVQDAFLRYAETDLLATIEDPLQPKPQLLRAACEKLGISTADDDHWDDLFFRIFLEKIEHKLGVERPTILYDYPVSMAALARPKPGMPHLAERFELYVCGLELANAFGELTDPVAQRSRFESEMAKKQRLYGERYPIDEDFLAALGEMPEASGIALGVDRLVMLLTGASHIENVLWVPVAEPEWEATIETSREK